MSTIIIITPPTKPPGTQSADEPDGFAQELAATSPYDEAADAIAAAKAAGCRVRIIGD